jgi:hypothetical protein
MRKRTTIFRKHDETTIIIVENPASFKTFVQRILHWIGEAMLWLLACGIPLLIILSGFWGIHTKHVPAWRMRREKFGNDAVSYSLEEIGFGLCALGYCCYLKTGKKVFSYLGWIVGIGVFGLGFWLSFRAA